MVSASTGFDGSSARGNVGKTDKKEVFMSERCFGVVFRLGGGGYLGNLTAKGAEVAQRMQSEKGSWGGDGLRDATNGRVEVGI